MTDNFIVYPETKEYLNKHFKYPDQRLKEYHQLAIECNSPIIQNDLASFLFVTMKSLKPKLCLELGTNIGYSAAWMALANSDCSIDTVEFKKENVEFASEQFKKLNIDKQIKVHQKEALEYLKSLEKTVKYDFVFIDANKKDNRDYIEELDRHLNNNAMICIDNILWKGKTTARNLVEFSSMESTLAIRKFCRWMKDNPKYFSQVLAIGDGVLLATRL